MTNPNPTEGMSGTQKFLAGAERMLNDGVQPYYESQLATLPEKDASWPTQATSYPLPTSSR